MRYRYTRYTGEDLAGIDLEELVSKLSDQYCQVEGVPGTLGGWTPTHPVIEAIVSRRRSSAMPSSFTMVLSS